MESNVSDWKSIIIPLTTKTKRDAFSKHLFGPYCMHTTGLSTVMIKWIFVEPKSKQRSDSRTEYLRLVETQETCRHCG